MLEYLTPLLIIVVLVLLNGLFVAAEFALVASRRSRLNVLAGKGNGAAQGLLRIFDHPTGKDRYIAIAQLGITLASIGLGMYGEPAIAKWLYGPFEHAGLSYAAAHTLGFIIALSLITFMHVVFGEMIPKALALQTPEAVSVRVNPLMRVFGFVFRPLIAVLSVLALGLMRLLRIREPGKDALLYTSKELSIITEESAQSGQLGEAQRDLIQNIFALEDRTAQELMTPRRSLEVLSVDATPEDVLARITRSPRSRYPVYEDHLDEIIGVLHVKDFIRARATGHPLDLGQLVRPLPSLAAGASAEDLLALFKRERMHAALIVDEFGGTLGFVTMDDLIEDVMEEDDDSDSDWLRRNPDGSYSLDGEVTLSELREDHGLNLHSDEVTTVAGLVLEAHGTVPQPGLTVHVQGHDLTAEAVDGLKITRIRVRPVGTEV
ncbi:hemolysin family protein [Deinococcus humi]|uniref:CBS domain containing-hemolysin-like protein n=1 Tax=Deinococcus humi TaxID=662880 RepID=A0A7W8NEA3_9DEIO|nr:hemolysin family protein [Deinococcus humi]MBB5362475.1 CBS domain containing-hemolysin-like protein [Deinococcus humi]GGO28665.1 hemolysin [Deinococcus humi]